MKLMEKKGSDNVKLNILSECWGVAEAGKTTAIMGASGAGKTSLFQLLAGRVPSGGKLVTEGEMYYGGAKFDPTDTLQRNKIAYVAQEDSLCPTSTIREHLFFSARLRLPKTTSAEMIDVIITELLADLGLAHRADTVIGGGLVKGISGGEKRRVSIGIELVSNPSLIFLDEPTSGLDSFAASKIMSLLDRVAKAGNTVVFTIHQPSSKIFNSFDRLILLEKGHVMHQGDVSAIAEDFADYGFPIPKNYNAADWVLEVAQSNKMEDLKASNFFKDEAQVIDGPSSIIQNLDPETKSKITKVITVGIMTEFQLLQDREVKKIVRNPFGIVLNVGITAVLSIIFAVIFLGIGREDRAINVVTSSILGAIVNVLISTMMGQSNPALLTFAQDRPLFLREYSTNHYSIIPYFLSKLWTEALNTFIAMLTQALVVYWTIGLQMGFGIFLAITYTLCLTTTAIAVLLGACFSDIKNALSCFTIVVIPQFYFSGVFIAIQYIPIGISWIQYICSLMYASRLSFAYEFRDCAKTPGSACDDILKQNNVVVDDIWFYWLMLLLLFAIFRCLGVVVLRSKAKY